MKKKTQAINTKSHGYVLVDDSEIVENDAIIFLKTEWIGFAKTIRDNRLFGSKSLSINEANIEVDKSVCKKLIATSTEHKIEGVLQYTLILKDNEAEKLGNEAADYVSMQGTNYPIEDSYIRMIISQLRESYKEGFKAAKETYPFSEENMVNFAEFVGEYYSDIHNKVIPTKELLVKYQSLKQQTLSGVVEVEYEEYMESGHGGEFPAKRIKLNSQGHLEIHI